MLLLPGATATHRFQFQKPSQLFRKQQRDPRAEHCMRARDEADLRNVTSCCFTFRDASQP